MRSLEIAWFQLKLCMTMGLTGGGTQSRDRWDASNWGGFLFSSHCHGSLLLVQNYAFISVSYLVISHSFPI